MVYIQLHYGPYESNGIIQHRPQRLHGIIQCLSKKGYEIELIQTIHLDRLTVRVGDTTVFRCNIKSLMFNIDFDLDVVCQRAVASIEEAVERIYADTNIPRHIAVEDGMRFAGTERTTADFFAPSVALLYLIDKKKSAAETLIKDAVARMPVTPSNIEDAGAELPSNVASDVINSYSSTFGSHISNMKGFESFNDVTMRDVEMSLSKTVASSDHTLQSENLVKIDQPLENDEQSSGIPDISAQDAEDAEPTSNSLVS